jgi:hypothetical protein
MYQKNFIKANKFITNLANWLQGKNTIKGATQVSGDFLKLNFCMFERSQKNIIVWIVINVFGIPSINYNVYRFKT